MMKYIPFSRRFDADEAITDGVETCNVCEISVDVATVGTDSWSLASDQYAHQRIIGKCSVDYSYLNNTCDLIYIS